MWSMQAGTAYSNGDYSNDYEGEGTVMITKGVYSNDYGGTLMITGVL